MEQGLVTRLQLSKKMLSGKVTVEPSKRWCHLGIWRSKSLESANRTSSQGTNKYFLDCYPRRHSNEMPVKELMTVIDEHGDSNEEELEKQRA